MWAFNDSWDHPRVLSSPKPGIDHVSHWSPKSYVEICPWMVPEKIFWEEVNVAGHHDPVISVCGYLAITYRDTLVGLRFVYESGAIRTIGFTHGEPTPEIAFESNKFSQIEWFTNRLGLFKIIVRPITLTLYCFLPVRIV